MRITTSFCAIALMLSGLSGVGQSTPSNPSQSQDSTAQSDKAKSNSAPSGVQILSDTGGVDFSSYLSQWHQVTDNTWKKLIPKEVGPPTLAKGMVAIEFKILPNGRIMDHSMVLKGRSGTDSLDRAAWSALTGSKYPALPEEFHGPFVELRAYFLYNIKPDQAAEGKPPQTGDSSPAQKGTSVSDNDKAK